jgi:hypothetical protein
MAFALHSIIETGIAMTDKICLIASFAPSAYGEGGCIALDETALWTYEACHSLLQLTESLWIVPGTLDPA